MRRHDIDDPQAFRTVLRRLPLFSGFSDEDLDRITASGALGLEGFEFGETLIEQGNYEKTFFVLLGGAVRVSRGTRELVDLSEPGMIFGEMSFILGKARTATVKAVTPCECLVVDMGYLDFFRSPQREEYLTRIFRFLAGIVTERLGSANARKAELLGAIRERKEAMRDFVARKQAEIRELGAELAELDTSDDEEVLKRILAKGY